MILMPQRGAHAAELRQRLGAGRALLLIRPPHIHVLPVRVERVRNAVAARSRRAARRPRPKSSPAAPNRPRLRPSHRRPTSVSSSAARGASNQRMETAIELDELAEVRLPLATLAMRAPFPRADSTTPPPASSAATSHGRPSSRLRWPGVPPPASGQTASATPPLYFCRINASTRVRASRPTPDSTPGPPADAAAPPRPACRYRRSAASPAGNSPPSTPPPLDQRQRLRLHPRQHSRPASTPAYSSLSVPIHDLHGRKLRGTFLTSRRGDTITESQQPSHDRCLSHDRPSHDTGGVPRIWWTKASCQGERGAVSTARPKDNGPSL